MLIALAAAGILSAAAASLPAAMAEELVAEDGNGPVPDRGAAASARRLADQHRVAIGGASVALEPLTVRTDDFHVLGWFDKTLNKRLYYFRGSDYSVEAAAVALSSNLIF